MHFSNATEVKCAVVVVRTVPRPSSTLTFVSESANEPLSELALQSIGRARAIVDVSSNVVVLTGAGISTDSKIPDFRGPKGVWTTNPDAEKLSNIDNYVADAELRKRAWMHRIESPVWDAEPNDGHVALLRLESRAKLDLLITQNIDGLHHKAGSDPSRIVEVHGTAREVVCLGCSYRAPMQDALVRVRAGESDPACLDCGGILKSATVSFGQSLVVEDLERSDLAARSCDLLIAIGSTLGVYSIANVVPVAKQAGASVVIVNGSATEMDELADVVVRGSISPCLGAIL